MRTKIAIILFLSVLASLQVEAQEIFNLQRCIDYALENNSNLKKSKLELEKSFESRREIMGSLLPQISGSGSLNYNLKKAQFVMPNFVNDMLPPNMQDPNASKYMTIEMGTNYSAGVGATLNQQILNFTLFSTLEIAKTAESMATLGIESKEEEVIAQTASIFYAVQSTAYAAEQFKQSIKLIDRMLVTMESNYQNGLVKKVDLDRLKVNRVNLSTQQSAIENAIDIQKNLLKLQMGMDINQPIEIEEIDLDVFEQKVEMPQLQGFELTQLIPFQLIQQQHKIGYLQVKSVKSELLPSLMLGVNYQYNLLGDKLFGSDDSYSYPTSVVGLNLRIPIFAGMSKNAKLKGAQIELMKLREDEQSVGQSLTMAYQNALLKLSDSRQTIDAQRQNMELAAEVFRITEENYQQGLASMSDVLNANSSLIQSQISYADALSKHMTAYIELRKANGTIKKLVK
ncbi:TolC family protein [Perlabentimonas gracilis]|uniref:TolC family protein n=1 Tax=Perlabentimonas gracilis TaxID=2715279 RepID=UPI001408F10C|nr:TolC family protein [Perlabentimonas gracilis]NHB68441.1 TolC family protein [Perlabentimonas gracilis]